MHVCKERSVFSAQGKEDNRQKSFGRKKHLQRLSTIIMVLSNIDLTNFVVYQTNEKKVSWFNGFVKDLTEIFVCFE